MFDHEPMHIIPIIENLTSQDMSSNTPRQLVSLLLKPLMSKKLRIEIVDFKGAMMDMYGRLLLNEKRMMINKVFPAIEMEKPSYIPAVRRIQYIRRLEREIVAIELERLVEIGTIDSEMAEFMH